MLMKPNLIATLGAESLGLVLANSIFASVKLDRWPKQSQGLKEKIRAGDYLVSREPVSLRYC